MKIKQLLEGSEILFHGTTSPRFHQMVKVGGIVLSGLASDHHEHPLVVRKLGISKKMYFLSLARSLHSMYLTSMIQSGYGVVLQFDGRTLSRYGKIKPVHFFDFPGGDDEMEDRLLSDHGMIPLTAVSKILVFCPRRFKNIFATFRSKYDVPMEFYSSGTDLMFRRKPKTFEEMFTEDYDDDDQSGNNTLPNHELFVAAIAELMMYFLDNELEKITNYDKVGQYYTYLQHKTFNKTIWQIRIQNPHIGNEIMKKLKKKGIMTPDEHTSWFFDFVDFLGSGE